MCALGAMAMLQEETAARKSNWRRVRQKEKEIFDLERKLSNQILFNMDTLKISSVKKQLDNLRQVSSTCLLYWVFIMYL